jgi:putative ABC transport system permease protein
MTGARRQWISAVERALRALLHIYPRRFRARFGGEVLASAREELLRADGPGALVAASAREIGQALAGVVPQHQLEHLRQQRLTVRETIMLFLLSILSDVRHGVRSLRKTPGFTAVALAVLTLGIGATTAIFSVVDAVVLRALPFDEHDRLVAVLEHDPTRPATFGGGSTTPQNYLDWRRLQTSFTGVAAVHGTSYRLRNEAGEPALASAQRVTWEFFDVLRVAPLLGRRFTPDDEASGRRIVLLSHRFWQRQYGGVPGIVGSSIDLNEERWEIVGVLPPDFSYPVGSLQPAELFVPLVFTDDQRVRGQSRNYNFLTIGRLRPGVSVASADTAMKQVTASLVAEHPKWYGGRTARVIPLHEQFVGREVRLWMLMLLGAVAFVLVIACANVANLMLARATTRARELGIRAALGAGRLRLIRGVLAENLVLSAAGTALGVAVGAIGVALIRQWLPAGIPRVAQIGVDWRVLGAAAAAAVVTGLLFGALPALASSKPDLASGLREGGRSGSAGVARRRVRSALVVAEVALATVLLVGAGLFLASFLNLVRVDMGFDYRGVLTPGSVYVPFDRTDTEGSFARGRAYAQDVVSSIASVPGVTEVAFVSGGLPLEGSWNRTTVELPGRGELKEDADSLDIRGATPGYLELMRLPLKAGRYLNAADREGAAPVIVINEAAARRYWGDESAIGQRVTVQRIERTVVGIVGDIRHLGPEQPARQEAYVPLAQDRTIGGDIVVRTQGDPVALLPAVKAAIWRVNPEQRLANTTVTLEGYYERLIERRRFNMAMLVLFGVLGLAIAAVGIYGVMAYLVSQRTSEFGLRMALGATRGTLVRMVIGQAGLLVATGLAIGAAAAWAASGWVSAFLFGVEGPGPVVFGAAVAVLAAAGTLAAALPARRAAGVDPLVALRAE